MKCLVYNLVVLLFLVAVQATEEEIKKIVIFGATGRIGSCALEAAVKKGLSVRAFVRNPSKIPLHIKDNVEIFEGNVLKPESVAAAVEGMDGVVIVLGTPASLEPITILSEGTKNIINAMQEKNVRTVSACISAFLFWGPEKVVPQLYVTTNEDHKRMYQALEESPLDWIAVFPPYIVDQPSHEVQVVVNPEKSPGRYISKWNLCTFLVDSLDDPKYYRTVVGISNAPEQ